MLFPFWRYTYHNDNNNNDNINNNNNNNNNVNVANVVNVVDNNNDVNAILYACAKTVEPKLEAKTKNKRKTGKNKKRKWKINIEKEIETMRGEMLILGQIEMNKDPKVRKARKVIKKHKITKVIDIPSIKEELKQKIQVTRAVL